MGLKDRIPQMTEEEQYALLASNGLLVKRPILVCDKGVLVGFKVQEWEDMLIS
jgi:arsenate reductase